MKQLHLILLLLVLCGSAFAGEPLVWIYAESWWENVTLDPANNCITQEPLPGKEPFVLCENARFRFTVRQSIELNPAANAHGVIQTVQIKDLNINQIVSQETKSDFYTGTTTIFTAQTSHEVDAISDGTVMAPLESRVQHIPQCPDTGHPGGGGTNTLSGASVLSYRFDSIRNPRQAWYTHRSHSPGDCPAYCGDEVAYAIVWYWRQPSQYAIIVVPFTLWICTYTGGGAAWPTVYECRDIYTSPL